MGKRRNNIIGSGIFVAGGVVWKIYDRATTVSEIPKNAADFFKVLADPPWYLPWVVIIVALIILAWSFWDKDETGESETLTQNSYGPNSSNYSGQTLIFNNSYGNAAKADEEPSKNKLWSDPEIMDRLSRVMRGEPESISTIKSPFPAPDILVSALYSRVYNKLGGMPSDRRKMDEFYKKVDREISDAVVINKLSTWGYYMDTPVRLIDHQSWRNGRFNHRGGSLSIQTDSVRPMVFVDLKFNKEETDTIWPPE